jgi:hypothetical protein
VLFLTCLLAYVTDQSRGSGTFGADVCGLAAVVTCAK